MRLKESSKTSRMSKTPLILIVMESAILVALRWLVMVLQVLIALEVE
jgi:hypothetical protein